MKSGSIVRAFLRAPVVCDHARPARPLSNLRKLRFPMELAWGEPTRIEAPAGSWERKGATSPFQSRMNFNEGTRSEKTGAFRLGYLLVQTHSNIDFLIGASQQPVSCSAQAKHKALAKGGRGQVRSGPG